MERQCDVKSGPWLNECASNVTSQYGEDGIIEKVLEVIGDNNRWCVEFGAWDGVHFSNTCNLVKSKEYSVVFIEGNTSRIDKINSNYKGYEEKVIAINEFVGFTENDGLDSILKKTPIPVDFDLLSVDIDGNDYHVWDATKHYRPKVVVIEHNPTMSNEVDFVQEKDMDVAHGSSLLSLTRLARGKGYELVAVTLTNAIFVDAKYFPKFGISDNSLWTMRPEQPRVTHIFNGYDGRVFLRGFGKVNWHRLKYKESKFQVIPRWLRGNPENYSPLKRRLAIIYRFLVKMGRD